MAFPLFSSQLIDLLLVMSQESGSVHYLTVLSLAVPYIPTTLRHDQLAVILFHISHHAFLSPGIAPSLSVDEGFTSILCGSDHKVSGQQLYWLREEFQLFFIFP